MCSVLLFARAPVLGLCFFFCDCGFTRQEAVPPTGIGVMEMYVVLGVGGAVQLFMNRYGYICSAQVSQRVSTPSFVVFIIRTPDQL